MTTTPPAFTDPPPPARPHLLGLTPTELQAWLAPLGQPRYRAQQIGEWIFQRGATSFDAMTNLPKALRAQLAEQADVCAGRVVRDTSASDLTRKLLLAWPDGATVETVWIPDGDRHTACLSSQVGCPVGCAFCASGIDGVQRNLTAAEIVEQALRIRAIVEGDPADADRPARRLSNIVMMGMGEPLANYDAVVAALRIINAPWGLGIGARKITVSTDGLPQQIRRLAGEDLQLNLALSLHAPDEELRRQLIPWGKVPLRDLLDACSYYFKRTGREITLEYVLLADVNDRPRHALGLARIARQLRANVNLLRYNPVPGLPFVRPDTEASHKFLELLRSHGINAHLRRSRGRDADAACGQLRRATGPLPLNPAPTE